MSATPITVTELAEMFLNEELTLVGCSPYFVAFKHEGGKTLQLEVCPGCGEHLAFFTGTADDLIPATPRRETDR